MSLSSSHRHLLNEIISWSAVTGLLFFAAAHVNDLRRMAETAAGAPAVSVSARIGASETSQADAPSDAVELKANRAGHFEANIEVNGRSLEALVDTGATIIVLTSEDAARAGIYPRASDYTMSMETANGRSRAAPVMLERVAIGPISVRDVQAAVAESGALKVNLLGMSFLQRLRKFEINSGRLVLQD